MEHSFYGIQKTPCGSDVVIDGVVFRVEEEIFQGSDSRIFSAHSLQGGGDPAFVVKRIDCTKDSDAWHSAMREIEAGEMLRGCANIPRLKGYSVIKDIGKETYSIFLLFDRLQCLDEAVVTDEETALKICRDICRALECLRRKGLVHGDVKPENLYFDGDKYLLGDLGSVCLSGEVPEFGSMGYLSPEAYRLEPCDIRSDIYSLGVTLYRLLNGRPPFCPPEMSESDKEGFKSAILRRLNGEEIPPLPFVTKGVNDLMLNMCRYDRRHRFKKPLLVAKEAERLLREGL